MGTCWTPFLSALSIAIVAIIISIITVRIEPPESKPQFLPEPSQESRQIIKLQHELVGNGLKRSYKVNLLFSQDLPLGQSISLMFEWPADIIVDVFQFNRDNPNAHLSAIYSIPQLMDLEVGTWSPKATPFTLTVAFKANERQDYDIMIPDIMMRYSHSTDCFHLPSPSIQIAKEQFNALDAVPITVCPPVYKPNAFVLAITLASSLISGLYLLRMVKASF